MRSTSLGWNPEPDLVRAAGAGNLGVDGRLESLDVADDRLSLRSGEPVDDRRDPHRDPAAADRQCERAADAARERREGWGGYDRRRGRIGRLSRPHQRVALPGDPVAELGAARHRVKNDAARTHPRADR